MQLPGSVQFQKPVRETIPPVAKRRKKGSPASRNMRRFHSGTMKLVETRDPRRRTLPPGEGVDLAQLAKDLSRFWNDSNLIRESIRYQVPSPRPAEEPAPGDRQGTS